VSRAPRPAQKKGERYACVCVCVCLCVCARERAFHTPDSLTLTLSYKEATHTHTHTHTRQPHTPTLPPTNNYKHALRQAEEGREGGRGERETKKKPRRRGIKRRTILALPWRTHVTIRVMPPPPPPPPRPPLLGGAEIISTCALLPPPPPNWHKKS
jgi:hypothetical protein